MRLTKRAERNGFGSVSVDLLSPSLIEGFDFLDDGKLSLQILLKSSADCNENGFCKNVAINNTCSLPVANSFIIPIDTLLHRLHNLALQQSFPT